MSLKITQRFHREGSMFMNKKFKYISIIGVLLGTLLFVSMCSKPKYQNIFEEMYHDEYSHATGSWIRTTASTLESISDMKKKNARELFYGTTVESYRMNSLPKNVDSINYTFYYPDDKLAKGSVSIFINLKLPNSDILQVEYMYQHLSNQLVQKIRVFSESFESEYPVKQYIKQKQLSVGTYTKMADNILKDKLISDWLSVYPSQFSSENWGDVEVVEDNTPVFKEKEE